MRTNGKLVSIIIPIFNTESYLDQCLESVYRQTYDNIEIILINDGSTDKSASICLKWCGKDDRFIYIEQENCGQGIARNRGVQLARGEYITFIDSDDWITPDYVKRLLGRCEQENADMCRAGMQYYDEYKACLGDKLDIPKVEASNIYCYAVPQIAGNIYRKNLFEKNNIKMPAGKMEDLAIFPLVAMLSKKISYEDTRLYYYRINRAGSSMSFVENYPKALHYMKIEAKRLNLLSNCYLLMQISILHLGNALERVALNGDMVLFSRVKLEFREYLSTEYPGWTRFYDSDSWIFSNKLFKGDVKTMKSPKVSIIVPVYNAVRYLRQCLESLVWQSLKEIEIICVNDGSVDTSLQILEEYALRDDRIVVINKDNGGYGSAMNVGLKAATGEYIGIVESDDFVDNNMFEELYKQAVINEVDIVKSNYYEYSDSYGIQNNFIEALWECEYDTIFCPSEFPKVFFSAQAIWSAIYRRTFLEKNDIKFNETVGASYQDTAFVFKAWAMAINAILIRAAYVHYRIDNGEASVKSEEKVFCICDEYEEIARYLKDRPEKAKKLESIVVAVKFKSYSWNYERLGKDHKPIFWKKFVKEFQEDNQNGLIDNRYWSNQNLWNLKCLLNNEKEKYVMQYTV